jgi:hypothetical protein
MPGPNEPNTEEVEFDITAGAEAISLDLFGEKEAAADPEVVEKETPSGEQPEVEPEVAAETTDALPPAAQDPNDTPPKTWTKEALAEWATIPPKVKAEIHKREADFFKGIEQYKETAAIGKAYDSVVEPYRAALAAENINPVELFKAFAANHYTLARGTIEQKVALVSNLIKGYGIDPEMLQKSFDPQPYVDPELRSVKERLAAMEREREMNVQREMETRKSEALRQVERFSSDPANVYFDKVSHLIPQLLQSGIAKDLPDAYQQAIMLHPEVRELEFARRQAEQAEKSAREKADKVAAARAASAANVNTRGKPVGGTTPVGSMDDTLAETMARLRAGA